MRLVIAFVLLLLAAPVAHATEGEKNPVRDSERPKPTVTEVRTEEPEIERELVRVERRATAEDAAAQDMPRRGSFWWVVGAIVVAGVILAVLL